MCSLGADVSVLCRNSSIFYNLYPRVVLVGTIAIY